jgi:DNA-binding response OmpR family regulator
VSCPLPRVLVIDDQPDVRTMVSIVLRINHFEAVEAASAAAGLKEFESSKFDLAIVDIFLQGTNGFEVIMKMRERIPDFPIVAISGMTMLDFVNETPELANVVCLQKPFRPAELALAVEVATRPSSSGAAARKLVEGTAP